MNRELEEFADNVEEIFLDEEVEVLVGILVRRGYDKYVEDSRNERLHQKRVKLVRVQGGETYDQS